MKDKDILTATIDCNGNQEDHNVTKGASKLLKAQGFRVRWKHSRQNGDWDWKAFKILLFGEEAKNMSLREIMLGRD